MPGSESTTAEKQSEVWDVIVLGGGAAGMAAAIFAALDGARTLLVERSGSVGGTSALSAGTVWIPNTRHAASAGTEDSPERAAAFLDAAVGNRAPKVMRDTFLRAGPEAVRHLEENTAVQFRARPFHPDYLFELEGSVAGGRALEALPFDGGMLGKALSLLRPPIPEFTVLGGMMVDRDDIGHLLKMTRSLKSLAHGAQLIAGYAVDRMRHGRGARLVMGNALTGRLLKTLLDLGVTVRTDAEVTGSSAGPDGTPVQVRSQGGEVSLHAAGGFILASGGFARHPQRRAELLLEPQPEFSPAAPGNTGALHDIALRLGARYGEGGAQPVFWAPVSRRRRKDGSMAVFPHFVLDRSKPGIISVGRDGRRFVNESLSYHQFVAAMYAANRDGSSIPAFEICDADALRKYGLGMVHPGGRGLVPFLADGYLVRADTLAELAGVLEIDPAGLAETVERMNGFAETGEDTDFQRGTNVYQRANGDPKHGPNPTLGPIRTAPFYAIRLWPGDIGAAIGLETDTDARVLGPDGAPLDGLYACGNDMHSVMGGVYPAPGINLGPAIAFAYLAARHAAARRS
ncbi:FAD-dependent oxidoreductase [Thalassobaculum salexigens]|uniref:FAD-dependent oxidoreductase n=1 Tax=Thalassobaculum salexigens TaxID=455360 RepID=UPI00248DAB2E|nr:FAD-dependent oxidoreductase [Thalassobaculum salexigens]